jgi:hypothetical protein
MPELFGIGAADSGQLVNAAALLVEVTNYLAAGRQD